MSGSRDRCAVFIRYGQQCPPCIVCVVCYNCIALVAYLYDIPLCVFDKAVLCLRMARVIIDAAVYAAFIIQQIDAVVRGVSLDTDQPAPCVQICCLRRADLLAGSLPFAVVFVVYRLPAGCYIAQAAPLPPGHRIVGTVVVGEGITDGIVCDCMAVVCCQQILPFAVSIRIYIGAEVIRRNIGCGISGILQIFKPDIVVPFNPEQIAIGIIFVKPGLPCRFFPRQLIEAVIPILSRLRQRAIPRSLPGRLDVP